MKIVRACLAVLLVACLGAPPSAGMQPTPGHTVGMPDANRVTRTADGSLGERWPAEPAMSDAMTRTVTAKPTQGRSTRTAGKRRTASGGGPGSARSSQRQATSDAPLRILFIGNSHTDRHGGIDWLVRNLAASEDPPRTIETERLVASGVTLEYHVQHGALERIRDGDWDIVVLQEYLPGSPTHSARPFYDNAWILDRAIRAAGARTVLYMTWPERLNTWATLDDISSAHRALADAVGASVAPVGEAMERAHEERPELSFLDWDGVHTTWEGAYLAAATIYAALFERSPEGLPYHLGISDGDAAFLQRIAWETVNDWEAGSGMARANASADASGTAGRSTATSATRATAEEPLPG